MRISDWSSDVCSSDLKMDDEPGAKIVAVGVEGEQLHPARVDADQWLVRRRWQAGNRPIISLRRARHRKAGLPIHLENPEQFGSLRSAQQPSLGRASWRERVGQYV